MTNFINFLFNEIRMLSLKQFSIIFLLHSFNYCAAALPVNILIIKRFKLQIFSN